MSVAESLFSLTSNQERSPIADEELARRVLSRRLNQRKYRLSDLFGIFGNFHRYYKLVILSSCVIGLATYFELELTSMSLLLQNQKMGKSEVHFLDCSGTRYSYSHYDEVEYMRQVKKSHRYQMDAYLLSIGLIVGPLICLAMARFRVNNIILVISILAFILRTLYIFGQESTSRISLGLSTVATTILWISILRYLGSSLPAKLIPFALFCIFQACLISETIFNLSMHFSKDHDQEVFITAPLYLVSGIFFFFCAPEPLLEVLVKQSVKKLKILIGKHVNPKSFDADGLIDDLVYKNGRTAVTSLDAGIQVYYVKPFLFRYFVLAFLICTVNMVRHSVELYTIRRMITRDLFSGLTVSTFSHCCVDLPALIAYYRIGPRNAVILSLGCSLLAAIMTCVVPLMTSYNSAIMDEDVYPESLGFVAMSHFLITFGNTIMFLAVDVAVISGYPVEHNSYLIAAHIFFVHILGIITDILERVNVCALTYLFISGILMVFVDFSWNNTLTTADVAALCEKKLPYSKNPEWDDDSTCLVTEESSSSVTSSSNSNNSSNPSKSLSSASASSCSSQQQTTTTSEQPKVSKKPSTSSYKSASSVRARAYAVSPKVKYEIRDDSSSVMDTYNPSNPSLTSRRSPSTPLQLASTQKTPDHEDPDGEASPSQLSVKRTQGTID